MTVFAVMLELEERGFFPSEWDEFKGRGDVERYDKEGKRKKSKANANAKVNGIALRILLGHLDARDNEAMRTGT